VSNCAEQHTFNMLKPLVSAATQRGTGVLSMYDVTSRNQKFISESQMENQVFVI